MCLNVLKKLKRNILLAVLLAILSCLFLPCSALAMEQKAAPTNIVMIPSAQWDKLRNNNKLLEEKLMILETKLILLDMPTRQLAEQLSEAKLNLEKSNQALANADKSLKNAEESLKRTEESLTVLEKQLDKEREKARKRIAREKRKTTVSVVVGCIIGYLLAR